MKRHIPILLLSIFVTGCATWTKVGGIYKNTSYNFHAELPWGWMKCQGKDLFITRDGEFLQNIWIERIRFDKELPFTKKRFQKDMLASEVAQVEIDNFSSNKIITNFELIENIPETINGINGFKLVYRFRSDDGLKIKKVHYGFLSDDWIYRIIYTAAEGYYFDKDLESFNKLVETFRLIKK
ncbi:MAG: hypothetical protein HY578_10130 [Nitrospinae bacterium]|nr:hypothetical protein [Nitrospinota bacterium]